MAALLAVFAFSLGLSTGDSARADRDVRRLYVGVSGGYFLTSPDLDLLGDRTKVIRLAPSGWANIRAGYTLVAPYLSVELNLSIVPMGADREEQSAIAMPVTLGATIAPLTGIAEPFFSVGAGLNTLVGGTLGTDVDFLFEAALGVRLRPVNPLGVRLEVRLAVSDAVSEPLSANPIFVVGVDYLGLPDEPQAPRQKTGTEGRGEPTSPAAPCGPTTAPCPDGDQDGVEDAADRCPETPGSPAMKGCPDTDDDSVADFEDDCPIHPGSAQTKGCPDRDRDGIHDGQDACPEDAGPADQQGCPSAGGMRLEDLGEPMQITFRRRSAKLTAEAREAIDKVVDLLNRHPKVRVEVRVWTDGKGKLTKHQALSASRAFAIVQALIARGIEAKRVRAAGQGKAKQDGARVILHRLANVQILE